MVDPAGFEPATWRVGGDVVAPAFAAISSAKEAVATKGDGTVHVVPPAFATAFFFSHTSVSFTSATQSRPASPEAKRAIVPNIASEKPPTFKMSARSRAWVVP